MPVAGEYIQRFFRIQTFQIPLKIVEQKLYPLCLHHKRAVINIGNLQFLKFTVSHCHFFSSILLVLMRQFCHSISACRIFIAELPRFLCIITNFPSKKNCEKLPFIFFRNPSYHISFVKVNKILLFLYISYYMYILICKFSLPISSIKTSGFFPHSMLNFQKEKQF